MKITPEQVIQQKCRDWFHNKYCLKHHSPSLIIYSIPNGVSIELPEKEKKRLLDLLRKTGMLKGASDLVIQGVNGRCINPECKTETGTQSDDQKEFERKVLELSGVYFLFRSLEEFQYNISLHIDWLLGKNT